MFSHRNAEFHSRNGREGRGGGSNTLTHFCIMNTWLKKIHCFPDKWNQNENNPIELQTMLLKIYTKIKSICIYMYLNVNDYMIPCSPKRVGDGIFMFIICQVFVCCRWLRHSFLGSVLKPRYFNLHPDFKKKRKKKKYIPRCHTICFCCNFHLIELFWTSD